MRNRPNKRNSADDIEDLAQTSDEIEGWLNFYPIPAGTPSQPLLPLVLQLYIAVIFKNKKDAQSLLEKGALSKANQLIGSLPVLGIAAAKNDAEMINLLLHFGDNPNACSGPKKHTALFLTTVTNSLMACDALLKGGALIDDKTFCSAVKERNFGIADKLLKHGHDINAAGPMLFEAALKGDFETIQYLLENNINKYFMISMPIENWREHAARLNVSDSMEKFLAQQKPIGPQERIIIDWMEFATIVGHPEVLSLLNPTTSEMDCDISNEEMANSSFGIKRRI